MNVISREKLIRLLNQKKAEYSSSNYKQIRRGICKAISIAHDMPTIDAVEVVRCRDCVFYKPRHIKLNDGSEREYLPGEDLVSIAVGINVGGQCMVEECKGYNCDKSVFREENDFCSRGIRKMDAEVEG